MGVDNAAVVRRFMSEVLLKGDLTVIDELADENVVLRDTMGTDIKGKDKLRELVKTMQAIFTDNTYDVEDLLVSGDRVVIRYTWRGTHRGEFFGIKPTGRTIASRAVDVLRLANGKVVEDLQYLDSYDLFRQLGLLPEREKIGTTKVAPLEAKPLRPG